MVNLLYRLHYLAGSINTLLLASQEFRDLPVSATLRKQAAQQFVTYAKLKHLIEKGQL